MDTLAGRPLAAPSFYHQVSRDVASQYTDEALAYWTDYLPHDPPVRIPSHWYEPPSATWQPVPFLPVPGPTPPLEALLASQTRAFAPLVEAAAAYAFMADFEVLLVDVPALDPHALATRAALARAPPSSPLLACVASAAGHS